jgi:hypothetical protein
MRAIIANWLDDRIRLRRSHALSVACCLILASTCVWFGPPARAGVVMDVIPAPASPQPPYWDGRTALM